MENNKMVSFEYIIENCFRQYNVYIPLIQRNYKWNAETAAKLAKDLWDAFKKQQNTYTVGMITFYKESNGTDSKSKLQLIDGQQRIITLFILLKYIMPNTEFFSFEFERDEGINEKEFKRKAYLSNITYSDFWKKEYMYTDIFRFKENYKKIEERLKECGYEEKDKDEFIKYIKNKIYFLLHISETEPFDEFMNLNNNKTRFVISDRIKANLIIDSENEMKKEEVLKLFQNLSYILFSDEDVWRLVKQGYCEEDIPTDNENRNKNKLYPDENRLKLLCCERYGSDDFDVSSTLGYDAKKEVEILKHYCKILFSIKNDISKYNENSYNAFNCLHQLREEILFFKMLKEKENLTGKLEEYFLSEINGMTPFEKACFIESQLGKENKKTSLDYIGNNKSIVDEFNEETDKTKKNWVDNGKEEFEIFIQIYSTYIDEKYKE